MKLDELTSARPGDFCLLCGKAPDMIGVFVPETPEKWGAPIGKTRLVRYCLCKKCQNKPDAPERVEKIIRTELTGEGVKHA